MTDPGTVIYRRTSKSSQSISESGSEDIWDDKILIDLYDRALNVAHEEVAKRFAMGTNSKQDTTPDKAKHERKNKSKKKHWSNGSECRAIYSEDGLEYEATIVDIRGDRCTVRYIGYNNEERVKLKDLKPSAGESQRAQQRLDAGEALGQIEEEINNEISECEQSDSRNTRHNSKSKKSKKKCDRNLMDALKGLPMPNLPSFLSDGRMDSHMPFPPPPFLPSTGDSASEDQTLSTMLISWYMSGYYTGLYQGMKASQKRN